MQLGAARISAGISTFNLELKTHQRVLVLGARTSVRVLLCLIETRGLKSALREHDPFRASPRHVQRSMFDVRRSMLNVECWMLNISSFSPSSFFFRAAFGNA